MEVNSGRGTAVETVTVFTHQTSMADYNIGHMNHPNLMSLSLLPLSIKSYFISLGSFESH